MALTWWLLGSLVVHSVFASYHPPECTGNLTIVGPQGNPDGGLLILSQPSIAFDWVVTIQEMQVHVDDEPIIPLFTKEDYDVQTQTFTIFAYYSGLELYDGNVLSYRVHLQATDHDGAVTNIYIPPTASGMVTCTYIHDVVLSYIPSLLWRNLLDVVIALGVLLGVMTCGCAFCMWKRTRDRKAYNKQVRQITDGSAEAFGTGDDKGLSLIPKEKKRNGSSRSRSVSFSTVERNDETKHHVISSADDHAVDVAHADDFDEEDDHTVTEFDRKDAAANRITDPRTPRSDRDIPFPVLSSGSSAATPPSATEAV